MGQLLEGREPPKVPNSQTLQFLNTYILVYQIHPNSDIYLFIGTMILPIVPTSYRLLTSTETLRETDEDEDQVECTVNVEPNHDDTNEALLLE